MNKTIWTYWHQGFNEAPLIVRKCIKQLYKLNPDYKIIVLDKHSIYQYIDRVDIAEMKWETISLPHQSDILRTQLLIEHGGVWIDPTVYCTKPLSVWLMDYMDAGVFFFNQPGPDRILANWFIAAYPGNYMLTTLYQSLVNYWNHHDFTNLGNNRNVWHAKFISRLINGRSLLLSQMWFNPIVLKILKIHPYMIYHYMAYRIVQEDERVKIIWNKIPVVPASEPLILQDVGLLEPMNKEFVQLFRDSHCLYKLSWKLNTSSLEGTLLDYLFRQY